MKRGAHVAPIDSKPPRKESNMFWDQILEVLKAIAIVL